MDGSEIFKERTWEGAGKSSKALQAGRNWKLRDVGRAENSGTVDEVVFGHDMDYTSKMEFGTAQKSFEPIGAAGNTSKAILSGHHLNDPRSRMHYPVEMYKHLATGNEETVDSVVFNHKMAQNNAPMYGHVCKVHSRNQEQFEDATGNKSGALNQHNPKISMQAKKKVNVYDNQRANVDEIIYGEGVDAVKYTEGEVEQLQYQAAGKSAVTKELQVRSESKKIVPHPAGQAAQRLFPLDEGNQVTKKWSQKADAMHSQWQSAEAAAGNSSEHNAHLKFREVEFIDNAAGARKGRSLNTAGNAGAAGKKFEKHEKVTKSSSPAKKSPGSGGQRAFGKPSGLRGHSESQGVASALNQPLYSGPPVATADAYRSALAAGRDLLNSSYTGSPSASPPKANRIAYNAPSYGEGDSAGNFRKEHRPLVSQARPEAQFGQSAPFGVDPVTSNSTLSRFTTSALSVGGKKRDNVMPYATADRSAQPNMSPSSAMVPAAGQRPKVPIKGR